MACSKIVPQRRVTSAVTSRVQQMESMWPRHCHTTGNGRLIAEPVEMSSFVPVLIGFWR
jgi:hypothetical protein